MSRLSDWVGRRRVEEDIVTLFPVRAMTGLLDRDPASIEEGTQLPRGWHWLFFRHALRRSSLGEDGHERRGAFLPPVSLPRRMWAAGHLFFRRPILVGDPIRRMSSVRSVEEKEGRTGRLVFVVVDHEVRVHDELAVEEEQTLVYREPGGARPASDPPALPSPDWEASFHPDTVTLFAFSALTFNGHRIHYDHPFVTEREGYPGLLVHAPLTALLLLDAAVGHGDGEPRSYSFRASRPLYADRTIGLAGRDDDGTTKLWATTSDGHEAMTGSVEW